MELISNADTLLVSEGAASSDGIGNWTVSGVDTAIILTVTARDTITGCETVIIVEGPECACTGTIDPPTQLGPDATVCDGQLVPPLFANPAAGATVDWYDAPSGGTLLRAGVNPGPSIYLNATPGTYYAASRNLTTGCSSDLRTPITLIINSQPTLNIVSSPCDDATMEKRRMVT